MYMKCMNSKPDHCVGYMFYITTVQELAITDSFSAWMWLQFDHTLIFKWMFYYMVILKVMESLKSVCNSCLDQRHSEYVLMLIFEWAFFTLCVLLHKCRLVLNIYRKLNFYAHSPFMALPVFGFISAFLLHICHCHLTLDNPSDSNSCSQLPSARSSPIHD
jgi:magnesium-transporting ATPase (P-type)